MTRQMNALFDEGRRKAIREALRKGEAVFAGRGRTEPLFAGEGRSFRGDLIALTSPGIMMSDPAQFKVGSRNYYANDYLLLAISYGDLEAAQLAISNGADVNHKVFLLPANPASEEEHPTRIGDPAVKTPLQYAQVLGRGEIEKFLRTQGARE